MHPAILTPLLFILGVSATPDPAAHRITPDLQARMASAPASTPIATWVFLADKGPDIERRLADAEAGLTLRARARRLRNRPPVHLVDWYDIPVDRRYVDRIEQQGVRIRHRSRWLNAVSVEATPLQIERITTLTFVRRMDIVHTSHAPLPEPEPVMNRIPGPDTEPYDLHALDYGPSFVQNNLINDTPLHDLGYNGNGVLICMLDSGFNTLEHDVFRTLKIHATWDFVNGDSIVDDEAGQMGNGDHGTFTLSGIAGFYPGELIGPAWGATYMLGKTENTTWERHIEEDHWVAGAEWADAEGADIISSSLGYLNQFTNGEPNYTWQDMDGETTIVTRGADIAASRGILVVNSAGNGGLAVPPANTLIGPCDGDSVLCVGAVGANGIRASFSSVGPTSDGRTKPDVMALGVAVRVAAAGTTSGYVGVSGTSLSCPLVAGAAALLLEANPSLSAMDIASALRSSGTFAVSPDNYMGWGIVDVTAAVQASSTAVPEIAGSQIRLYPAVPNPFNPSTTLRFELNRLSHVELRVFDVTGREVITLINGERPGGMNAVVWDGTSNAGTRVGTGVYFYELRAAGQRLSHKMVLLK